MDIDAIENVQRRAAKQIPELKNMTYKEQLVELKLPTLKYRRLRGDMIEMYNIMQEKYDQEACPNIKLREGTARGNNKNIFKTRARTKIRSHQFTNRTVDAWNNLPDSIIGAGTVGTFERRLDRFWRDQEVLFDCDQQLETSYRNPGHIIVPSDSDADLDI